MQKLYFVTVDAEDCTGDDSGDSLTVELSPKLPQIPYCDICGVDEGNECIKAVHEKWDKDERVDSYTTQCEELCACCDEPYEFPSLITISNDVNLPERKMFNDPNKAEEYVKTAYAHIFSQQKEMLQHGYDTEDSFRSLQKLDKDLDEQMNSQEFMGALNTLKSKMEKNIRLIFYTLRI